MSGAGEGEDAALETRTMGERKNGRYGETREATKEEEKLLSDRTPADGIKTILPNEELFALWGDPAGMDEKEWRRMSLRLMVGNIRASERSEATSAAALEKALQANRTADKAKEKVDEVLRRQAIHAQRSAKTGEEVAHLRAELLEVTLYRYTRDSSHPPTKQAVAERAKLRSDIDQAKKDAAEAKAEAEEASEWRESTGQFSTAILHKATEIIAQKQEHERALEKMERKGKLKLALAIIAAVVSILTAIGTALLTH